MAQIGEFFGGHPHPLRLLARLLGKESGLPCQDLGLLWSAIVFGAGLLIALLLWFEASELHGLRSVFEAPWSGLGQDVETAGVVEAVLRFAFVVVVLLLCLGLITIAEEAEDTRPDRCYPSDTSTKEGKGAGDPASLAVIEQHLASLPVIADTIKSAAGKTPPPDIVETLRAIDQHLGAIDSTLRLPKEPVNVQVTNTTGPAACPTCCEPPTIAPPAHQPPPHPTPPLRHEVPSQSKACTSPSLLAPVPR